MAASPRIAAVEAGAGGALRILASPAPAEASQYILESTASLTSPEWADTGMAGAVTAEGWEVLAALEPGLAARFFRVRSDGPVTLTPWIRYIAPALASPGMAFTLLGEGFSPVPEENEVRFESLTTEFAAEVRSASESVITGLIPAGLDPLTIRQYRVAVRVGEEESNGVGFEASAYPPEFIAPRIEPSTATLLMEPGTGRERLVIGGGVPPYRLLPLDEQVDDQATAVLAGTVIEVNAPPSEWGCNVELTVEDSQDPPLTATATVYVRAPQFAPQFVITPHSRLAGSAPNWTVDTEVLTSSMNAEWTQIRFANVAADFSGLVEGDILALMKYGRYGETWGYQYLQATEVTPSLTQFEVIAPGEENDTFLVVGQGTIESSPPTITLETPGLGAESLVPWSVEHRVVFTDGLLRLPASGGETVTVTADFRSVSVNKEQYLPMWSSVTQSVVTLDLAAGAPHVERVSPVHVEASRYLKLFGTGFDPDPAANTVTFAGPDGTRIGSEVASVEPDFLRVEVPREAASGPVRVTVDEAESNDFWVNVLFRPETRVLFREFTAGIPVGPLMLFEQPSRQDGDWMDTVYGDEIDFDRFSCALDQGTLWVAGLTNGQPVGSLTVASTVRTPVDVFEVYYAGPDPEDSGRHYFNIALDPKRKQNVARIVGGAPAEGEGVVFEVTEVAYVSRTGVLWSIEFTEPIYLPPSAPGVIVNTRCEAISQPWTAFAGDRLRVITLGVVETQ